MLVEAEIWTIARTDQGNAVLIRPIGAETAVPIFMGQLEAQSILIGLGSVPMPRPLTHDLFINIFKQLKTTILRIEINSLINGTFFARLILKNGKNELTIDCRPSDAIGLAVRKKCTIYIDEEIVDEAGIAVSSITNKTVESNNELNKTEIKMLKLELEKVIEVEDYEEAARIRDRINKLENDSK
ncbi:MAG: bifunctional nuclease domain-containing protein [Spirochaetota bacterium]|nr:bifunctional nuclease domain-containing protein [Spirochaetota bacterium]